MGRDKKAKKPNLGTVDTTEADKAIPKSIVIYRGEVGRSLRVLMHEWRSVFAPWSSRRLHATRNTIKDFQHIASVFGVSHLQTFSAPPHGATLRVARFPAGPNLTFRLESFVLREDILAKQRRQAPITNTVFESPAVVVLNNFRSSSHVAHVALMESTFQSLFPSVQVHTFSPSSLHRVALFNYDPTNDVVEVRHYWVTAKAVGLSKTVKKLHEGRLPTKLGTTGSVEEILDAEGAWSDTDGEGEEVALAAPFRHLQGQCRVKLVEIGPRMTLKLLKVESGLTDGEVLFHAYERKSAEQSAALAFKVRRKSAVKAKRRQEQKANVDEKRQREEDRKEAKRQKGRRLDSGAAENSRPGFEEAPQ